MRLLLTVVLGVCLSLVASPAQAAGKYSVSLYPSSASLDHGQRLTLKGTVTPNAKGQKVSVQLRIGSGSWKTVATRTLSSGSQYFYSVTPGPGVRSYRVVKARSSTRAAGYSRAVGVSIYRWRDLVDVSPLAVTGVQYGTFSIGRDAASTVAYPKSVRLSGSYAGLRWLLEGRRCVELRTWLGADVGTTSQGAFLAQVGLGDADGSTTFQNSTVAKDDWVSYVKRTVDPTTPFVTLDLQSYRTAGSSISDAVVFGTPRVRCAS